MASKEAKRNVLWRCQLQKSARKSSAIHIPILGFMRFKRETAFAKKIDWLIVTASSLYSTGLKYRRYTVFLHSVDFSKAFIDANCQRKYIN